MSMGKVMLVLALSLFVTVTAVGVVKKAIVKKRSNSAPIIQEKVVVKEIAPREDAVNLVDELREDIDVPEVDRVAEFFNLGLPKFPIVETITYSSKVPWKEGKAAWIVDYAAHYKTSRHFIARSLNRRPDYDTQQVANGDKFNVLNPQKTFDFHLVVDIDRAKLLFYYYDHDTDTRELVKTYSVGLGRPAEEKASGYLTPLGKYSLGKNVAVYRPGSKGFYNGEKTEMIKVFGTRWMPFDGELGDNTEPAKGYGIHGAPWVWNDASNKLVENRASVGKYESDGCIRMLTEDMEEIFSIVITRPTYVYIVRDFRDASLPGKEQQSSL